MSTVGISVGDLAQPKYWEPFLNMVENKEGFMTKEESGGGPRVGGNGLYWVDVDHASWKKVKSAGIDGVKSSFHKDGRTAKIWVYRGGRSYGQSKPGQYVALSHLDKENIKESGYNLGNVAEGILACAIAARFKNKRNNNITDANIDDIITLIRGQTGQQRTVVIDSPNLNTKVVDHIHLTVELARADMNLLTTTDPAQFDALYRTYPSIKAFLQSRDINYLATECYTNNIYNKIVVEALGITGGGDTTVDVNLRIDPDSTITRGGFYFPITGTTNDMMAIKQISLKRNVNQFGQVGGWDRDKQDELWQRIIGQRPSSNGALMSSWDTEIANGPDMQSRAINAVNKVYDWAGNIIETNCLNPQSKTVFWRRFADAIEWFATRREENVIVVNLKEGARPELSTAQIFQFDGLYNGLVSGSYNLKVLMEDSSDQDGRLPDKRIVRLIDDDISGTVAKKTILSFRLKYEKAKDYFRNYVEKGDALHRIIGAD